MVIILANKKAKIEAALDKHLVLRESSTAKSKPGRPRLEELQPELIKTIINMAIPGSAAHEKRQSEVYRSILTLNDLHDQLKKDGFHLSRNGLYLRLMPKRSSSLEGKRHISTVPVKLIRAQNDHHQLP